MKKSMLFIMSIVLFSCIFGNEALILKNYNPNAKDNGGKFYCTEIFRSDGINQELANIMNRYVQGKYAIITNVTSFDNAITYKSTNNGIECHYVIGIMYDSIGMNNPNEVTTYDKRLADFVSGDIYKFEYDGTKKIIFANMDLIYNDQDEEANSGSKIKKLNSYRLTNKAFRRIAEYYVKTMYQVKARLLEISLINNWRY